MSKMSMVNAGVSKFSGLELLQLALFDAQVECEYNSPRNRRYYQAHKEEIKAKQRERRRKEKSLAAVETANKGKQ